jgi:hypothetical protein
MAIDGVMATAMEGAMATATAQGQYNGNGGNGWRGGDAMATEGLTATAGSSSKIT